MTFFTYMDNVLRQMGMSLGNYTKLDPTSVPGQIRAYVSCPVVTSIINKRNDALGMGKWAVRDEDKNEVTDGKNEIFRLMKRPNIMQTWKAFVSQLYTFRDAHGIAYVLPVKPFAVTYATSWWVIPNWMVTPIYTGNFLMQTEMSGILKGYQIAGFSKLILPEEMIVFRDTCNSISQDPNHMLEPQSRLYNLGNAINTVNIAFDARLTTLEKRGPLGMFVNDNAKDDGGMNPLLKKDKEAVQEELKKYGVTNDKWQYVFASVPLKWVTISANIKDLMIDESVKSAAEMICDAYNISPFLMPWADQTTFTNQGAAEKRLYSNVTIPDAQSIADTLMDYYHVKDEKLCIECDFDHIDALQESLKDISEGLKLFCEALKIPYDGKIITKTEFRKLLAYNLPEGFPFDAEVIDGTDFSDGTNPKQINVS